VLILGCQLKLCPTQLTLKTTLTPAAAGHTNFVIIYLKPLPDTEIVLYESRFVQRQKRTMNQEVLGQSDQEQTAFRVCRRYGVSSAHMNHIHAR